MKMGVCYMAIVLLGSTWFAADAAPQPGPDVAMPAGRNLVVENEADYALMLKDPFSPIGYHSPMEKWQAPVNVAAVVSNVPPPSIDLKTKAKALLRVSGIIKSRDKYLANINGTVVRAGDEVGVTVDGQTVMFVIRAISLKRIQIEPKE